ncbi:hypothetical protein T10_5302 [Trichinella papuae]|uniref:Uncharacterized protein n=1 Tax=Trichinella papuae TaxID=268474 RepID=A0A0V1M147_9BILA|nr:hypothetical protein T10_6280 [Trichinella papuae]KRZ68438.1 hypothetical protein T10_5302 [Trichinella papuae]
MSDHLECTTHRTDQMTVSRCVKELLLTNRRVCVWALARVQVVAKTLCVWTIEILQFPCGFDWGRYHLQIIVVWTRLIPFGFTSENNEDKLVLVKITVANYLFRLLCTRSPRCALLVSCAFNFAPRAARSTRRINEIATLCSSAFLIATIFVRKTHFLHSPARWHPRLGHSSERDARHSLFLNYLLVDPVTGAATVTSFTGRRPCFKAGVARLHNVA